MRRIVRVLAAIAMLTCASLGALAQQPSEVPENAFGPNLARGGGGDLDSVSNFNGALSISVPVGSAYPAGGQLSYSLTAHYTSNDTEFRNRFTYNYNNTHQARGFTTQVPYSLSNAGRGWQLHLGRLHPPSPSWNDIPLDTRDRMPNYHASWMYIAPDGSESHFFNTLHGETPVADVMYTRNGSYIRFKLLSPSLVNLEHPNGDIHVFEKRPVWPDMSFNRDEWRLTAIKDRSGNRIDVTYHNTGGSGANYWAINDQFGRVQKIFWEPDPWFGGRVDRVELTAFNNQTAVYNFNYASPDISFGRWDMNHIHILPGSHGRLQSISRPDGAKYDFTYTGFSSGLISTSLITAMVTPTGARHVYEYQGFSLPSSRECDERVPSHFDNTATVKKRRLESLAGALLLETTYLRSVQHSPLVPVQYCLDSSDNPRWHRPEAELVVATFQKYAEGKGRLDLNYYSVFPISRSGPQFGPGQTPWKSEEFGQPFTRDEVDSASGGLLSIRTYDCPFNELPLADPETTAQTSCVRQRSTYLVREQDYSLCRGAFDPVTQTISRDANWECLGVNPRNREVINVYHDDADTRTTDKYIEHDGFGNFRVTRLAGNVSRSDTRNVETNFNPGKGELRVDAQGVISSTSTWSNYGPNDDWILSRYIKSSVSFVPALGRELFAKRTTTCFLQGTGLVRRIRVHKNAQSGEDEGEDVLYEYNYDDNNHPALPSNLKIYGGDGEQLANGGCNIQPSTPRYTIRYGYSHGVLVSAFHAGATDTITNLQTDASTGLPKFVQDTSGALTETLSYDLLGRLTSTTRNAGLASDTYQYFLPGVGGWTGAPLTVETQSAGNKSHRFETYADEIGRPTETRSPHPGSGQIAVRYKYGPDGALVFQTTPQSPSAFNEALGTVMTRDLFGRLVSSTKPDNDTVSIAYEGIGGARVTQSVGTTETGGGVSTSAQTEKLDLDRHGNVLETKTPLHTTTRQFDAQNRMTIERRGAQQRVYTFDGRGFLASEKLPEIGTSLGGGTVLYGGYDALGNVGFKQAHGSPAGYVTGFTYDSQGRLKQMLDNRVTPFIEFTYGTQGPANGKLVLASRINAFGPSRANSFGFFDNDVITVGYSYQYLPNGEVGSRQVAMFSSNTLGRPLRTPAFLQFDQSWQYDGFKRITHTIYPFCSTNESPSGADCTRAPWEPRTVFNQYGSADALASVSSAIDTYFGGDIGAQLTYHQNGQMRSIAHRNGRSDWFGAGPGGMVKLSSVNLAGVSGNSNQAGLLNLGSYGYDGVGNLTKIGSEKFVYDANGRLIKATLPGSGGQTETYGYDQYGNITQLGATAIGVNAATNRLSASDVTYDYAGRLRSSGGATGFQFAYDSFNISAMAYTPSGSPAACDNATGQRPSDWCEFYVYGPDNQRVAVIEAGGSHYANATITFNLRDLDGKTLRTATMLNASGQVTMGQDYIYAGRNLISSYGHGNEPYQVRHYHTDHLGSVRLATNTSGAQVGSSKHYKPYGGVFGADTIRDSVVDWAGYEQDPNSLTHNLGARKYFEGWGRFLAPDDGRDGWNLYAYAGNRPMTMRDPSGYCATSGSSASCTDQQDEEPTARFYEEIVVWTIDNGDGTHSDGANYVAGGWMPPGYVANFLLHLDGGRSPGQILRDMSDPRMVMARRMEIAQNYINQAIANGDPIPGGSIAPRLSPKDPMEAFVDTADEALGALRVIKGYDPTLQYDPYGVGGGNGSYRGGNGPTRTIGIGPMPLNEKAQNQQAMRQFLNQVGGPRNTRVINSHNVNRAIRNGQMRARR